jgi:hypothetical protein
VLVVAPAILPSSTLIVNVKVRFCSAFLKIA